MSDCEGVHLDSMFKCSLSDLSEVHVFIAPEVNDCLLAAPVALYLDKVRHQEPELSGLVK